MLKGKLPVKSLLGCFAGALMCTTLPASAVVDCAGEVSSLSLQLNNVGTVTLSLAGGPAYTYLCDIDGPGRNGVSPQVCRTMYATLLTAKATNKKVTIRFYDHNACSAVPAWANSGALGWTVLLTES